MNKQVIQDLSKVLQFNIDISTGVSKNVPDLSKIISLNKVNSTSGEETATNGSSQGQTCRVCVKVKYLRINNCDNFEQWLKEENDLYCGRHGRIFIGSGESKRIFHYKASKLANPFPVKTHGLDECLRLFEQHLLSKPDLMAQLVELKEKNWVVGVILEINVMLTF